jgi:hypothetical protein
MWLAKASLPTTPEKRYVPLSIYSAFADGVAARAESGLGAEFSKPAAYAELAAPKPEKTAALLRSRKGQIVATLDSLSRCAKAQRCSGKAHRSNSREGAGALTEFAGKKRGQFL